ncbi:unnamed protein product [Anisakis simplex]|uniref:Conjugal transfer protein TraO n=1 Tax=Anisakis simplex TaxID=6269 RepID=A0A0M3JQ89_ANISI|nr:unnamed protein product [Anisakis simplex]
MYMTAYNRLDNLKAFGNGTNIGNATSTQEDSATSSNGHSSGMQSAAGGLPQCIDSQWIETTNAKAQAKLEILSADFKRQKDEGVKIVVLGGK